MTRGLPPRDRRFGTSGFTVVETLVAMAVLLTVMATVTSIMQRYALTQSSVWNRSDMHGAVRSATELLQQEVGQAGRISLPGGLTISSDVNIQGSQAVTVTSTAGMFVGEQLVVDTGVKEETVRVTAINSGTSFTATFALTHAQPFPVSVRGGFSSGVVPPNVANGSSGTVLKLYGDINGDGSMVYIEYECDTNAGTLSRNMMPITAAVKPAVSPAQVLLRNIVPNPPTPPATVATPCFTYEQRTVNGRTYVINVAITLTSQSEHIDRFSGQLQRETKALLNVAPRNVFETWQLASIGAGTRLQPMPPSVAALLP